MQKKSLIQNALKWKITKTLNNNVDDKLVIFTEHVDIKF